MNTVNYDCKYKSTEINADLNIKLLIFFPTFEVFGT